METRMPGNRNILYLIIGALIVAVAVLGYTISTRSRRNRKACRSMSARAD